MLFSTWQYSKFQLKPILTVKLSNDEVLISGGNQSKSLDLSLETIREFEFHQENCMLVFPQEIIQLGIDIANGMKNSLLNQLVLSFKMIAEIEVSEAFNDDLIIRSLRELTELWGCLKISKIQEESTGSIIGLEQKHYRDFKYLIKKYQETKDPKFKIESKIQDCSKYYTIRPK